LLGGVTGAEKVHGFWSAFWPFSAAAGRSGKEKDACDQTQWVPEAEQTFTGWLSVTTVATE